MSLAALDNTAYAPREALNAKPLEEGLARRDGAVAGFHDLLTTTRSRKTEAGPLDRLLCATILELDATLDITAVAEAMPTHERTLTRLDLDGILSQLEYLPRRFRGRLPRFDRRLLPCLFTRPGEEIPVLVSEPDGDRSGAVVVFDPLEGRSQLVDSLAEVCEAEGEITIFLRRDPDRVATSAVRRAHTGFGWFRAVLGRFQPTMLQLLILSAFINAVGLGVPLFVILVYDRALGPRLPDPILMLTVGALLAVGAEHLLRSLRANMLAWLAGRTDFVIGSAIFERLVGLPPALIEKTSAAAQISRIKTFEAVRDFFTGPIFASAIELPTIILSIGLLLFLGKGLILPVLIAAAAYAGLFFFLRGKVRVAMSVAGRESSDAQKLIIETFSKLPEIRAGGLSGVWLTKLRDASGRENAAALRLSMWGSVGESATYALTALATLGIMVMGVDGVWSGQLTSGALFACMMLAPRVLAPMATFCTMAPRLEQIRNSIQQIDQLMDLEPESMDGATTRIAPIEGSVSFQGVALRYGRETAFSILGLQADIRAGEIIGVSGPNGSGKSSLLKLIQGHYAPQLGAVRIDGMDIRQVDPRELRRRIAYVPQHPHLFAGSIAQNLRYVSPTAADDALWRVLDGVGAGDIVRRLAGQLDAQIEDHPELTGDKAFLHRMAFARAILQNSRLILVDEIPNALLNAGLSDVMSALIAEARGARTVIYVTHRVDLLRMADKVVALRIGTPPLFGTLDQVMETLR